MIAKLEQMLLLALLQSILIASTFSLLFGLPVGLDIGPSGLGYAMAAFLTILASGSLALLVSTMVRDQKQASSSSQILLMPQLILLGVLFKVEQLAVLFPMVDSRWSVKLFGANSHLEGLKPHLGRSLGCLPWMSVLMSQQLPTCERIERAGNAVTFLCSYRMGQPVSAALSLRIPLRCLVMVGVVPPPAARSRQANP